MHTVPCGLWTWTEGRRRMGQAGAAALFLRFRGHLRNFQGVGQQPKSVPQRSPKPVMHLPAITR